MTQQNDDDRKPLLKIMDGDMPPRGDGNKYITAMLGIDSNNFCGSGMSMSEWMRLADFLRYRRSILTQPQPEKGRRLNAVIALAAELERIRAQEGFATAWCEMAIEAVIEGDWNRVAEQIKYLEFNDGHVSAELRAIMNPRMKRFREIAQGAYDARPRVHCPSCMSPLTEDKIRCWPDGRHECWRCKIVFDDDGKTEDRDRARLSVVTPEATSVEGIGG